MSESGSNGDSGPGRREVAHRLFATEFDAASLEYADSDEERAPKYVITPTGARVNRLFVVGVLTEVERVNDDVVRARVVDPTGAFVVYAGQYQPDALAFLERADPPTFVAVTGKANTFQPEDSGRVFTSVRPESIAEVDGETRDRWTVYAAEHTLRRIDTFARALETDGEDEDALVQSGFDSETANGITLAREEYGTTPAYLAALHETALGTARLVTGEVEAVDAPAVEPGENDGRAVDLADLRVAVDTEDLEVATGQPIEEETTETSDERTDSTDPSEPTTAQPESEPTGAESDDSEPVITEETTETTESTEEGVEGSIDGRGRSDSDALGDFDTEDEPTSAEADTPEPESGAEAGDTGEGELYEFDAEERAEIEAEFDMEFSSGSEVGEPGEADIDMPDTNDLTEEAPAADETQAETTAGTESEEPASENELEDSEGEGDETTEDSDVSAEDRAMEMMRELADGDGADREAVVGRVSEELGVDPTTVDDAIESALLSGRCYEPQDGVLKPI